MSTLLKMAMTVWSILLIALITMPDAYGLRLKLRMRNRIEVTTELPANTDTPKPIILEQKAEEIKADEENKEKILMEDEQEEERKVLGEIEEELHEGVRGTGERNGKSSVNVGTKEVVESEKQEEKATMGEAISKETEEAITESEEVVIKGEERKGRKSLEISEEEGGEDDEEENSSKAEEEEDEEMNSPNEEEEEEEEEEEGEEEEPSEEEKEEEEEEEEEEEDDAEEMMTSEEVGPKYNSTEGLETIDYRRGNSSKPRGEGRVPTGIRSHETKERVRGGSNKRFRGNSNKRRGNRGSVRTNRKEERRAATDEGSREADSLDESKNQTNSWSHRRSQSYKKDHRRNQTDTNDHRRNQTDISDRRWNRTDTRDHRRKQKEVRNHGGNYTDIMDYRSNQTDIRYHRRNQTDIRDHRRKQKEVRNHGGNSTDIMDHRSNQTEIRYHRRNQTDIRDHRRNMTDISNHRRNLTDLGVQRKNLANLRDHRRNRTDAKEHRRNRTQGYLGNGDRRGANPISIDSDAPLGNTRDAKAVSLNGTFNISDSVDVEGQSDVTEGSGCEGDTCEDSDGMGKDISASVDSADVRATDYDYAEESEVDEFAGHSDDFGETYDPREKNQELTPGYAAHLGRKGPRGNRQVKPWPNAVIPYIVVGSETTKMRVLKALEHIKSKTCLTFKSRANEQRYLHIKDHDGGCWTSSLGYPSSDKAVIVGLGNGCRSVGGVIHEVLHAAGFFHEHNRPDRNAFIEIKWSNIDRKQRHNFRLENRYSLTDVPYDYKSVMHYGRKAFAVDRSKPTLVPKTPMKGNLGGSRLTPHDVERINAFYNC